MFCEQFCNRENRNHIHFDHLYDGYFGIDLENLRESHHDDPKQYPCKLCNTISDSLENHIKHIEEMHKNLSRAFKCKFPQCGYKSLLPEPLTRHMAVKHNEYMKNKLKGIRNNIVF